MKNAPHPAYKFILINRLKEYCMKKIIICCILVILFGNGLFGQNAGKQSVGIRVDITYIGEISQTPPDFATFIKFSSNNRIEMWDEHLYDESGKRNIRTGTYSVIKKSALDFITISWDKGKKEEYLFLTNNALRNLYLYTDNSLPYFGELNSTFTGWLNVGNSNWINATSSFKETQGGRIVDYSPDKLGLRIGECWVPVKELNEKLTLKFGPQMATQDIYISSGFVSFTNPNLFTDNSRIKKIRLSDSSGKSRIIELLDTPHFQAISISDFEVRDEYGKTVVIIEILEVYPGAKYRDTCVNSILWKFSQ